MLAEWPAAVAALTKIFLDETERLLCDSPGGTSDGPAPGRSVLGGLLFADRFRSMVNRLVHLHA
jgi:hypothetical protein